MNLSFSLRRRLVLALLLALALAGLVVWELVRMVRTSTEQRVQFTRSLVTQELEHVAVAVEGDRPTLTGLRSGIALARGERQGGRGLPDEVDAVLRAQITTTRTGERRFVEVPIEAPMVSAPADGRRREANMYLLGVLGRDDGTVAWVAYPVRTPPFAERFRNLAIAFAVLVLALAMLTLWTVGSVSRGVRGLTGSLAALDVDLHAEVARPKLAELRQVADGIRALAQNLASATEAREAMAGELQRRERLAALGRVVAGVAHEVRNPLASLKLQIDLARSDPATSEGLRGDLGGMAREVERLDRLVSDLLVLGGRRSRSRSDEDLHALVRERAQLLAPWAEERGVTIRASAPPAPLVRSVDRDGISQALDNLLRNAVEAAPHGSQVDWSCDGGGERLRVCIEDPGPGVAEDRKAELFEPFFTTKPEGLGLGLATARAFAVAEGGELRYDRDGGKTRFTLEL